MRQVTDRCQMLRTNEFLNLKLKTKHYSIYLFFVRKITEWILSELVNMRIECTQLFNNISEIKGIMRFFHDFQLYFNEPKLYANLKVLKLYRYIGIYNIEYLYKKKKKKNSNKQHRQCENSVHIFTCMYICVFFHVRFLVESFPAIWTRIRSRVAMDEKMSKKGRWPLEWFSTLLALKRFFLSMNGSVLRQTHRMTKSFVANVTSIRSSAAMRTSNVDFQTMRCAELFQTFQTFV